jgi:hypothetical protein
MSAKIMSASIMSASAMSARANSLLGGYRLPSTLHHRLLASIRMHRVDPVDAGAQAPVETRTSNLINCS